MANATVPDGPQYHSWKSEPLARGTFSILSSSLLTMILCVWTAVHLNIPEHGKANAQTWRKLGWMIIALLAPEWVLLTAYSEHGNAIKCGKAMRKAFAQPEPPGLSKWLLTIWKEFFRSVSDGLSWLGSKTRFTEESEQRRQHTYAEPDTGSRRHLWTHTHSLYATMGGFSVDTRGLDHNYFPNGWQRMTLTLDGLQFIAELNPDLVPDLSVSEIQDKSKANAFVKIVACGQALWFGTQCLTRLTQSLSISLLEVNTAVHAVCVLALYSLFWWDKPLDVEQPTICSHADIHSLAAFITVGRLYHRMRLSQFGTDPVTDLDLPLDSADIVHHPTLRHIMLRRTKEPHHPNNFLVYRGFALPISLSDELTNHTYMNWTEAHFIRLELASEAVQKFRLYEQYKHWTGLIRASQGYLTARSRNRPNIDRLSERPFERENPKWSNKFTFTLSTLTRSFAIAGLFYGSVHLLVWNRPFRSEIDELLWKMSSLTILVSGVPVVIGGFCFDMYRAHQGFSSTSNVLSIGVLLFQGVSALFMLFYFFCRTFIIVECILDVFHLPDSAFEVPRWSQYFPHIG